ncbi:MAG TPA: helix-turn-helix transcriptional regulator [Thermomicrobiales bacterium]|nr:helix-turn-helix transcriptional regulator [Thermomicrobiales bacterium]
MNRTPVPDIGHRYVATANLAAVLQVQGRKTNWLAERVGVSEALAYKIVAGTKTADAAMAERIATALGVPLGLLFESRERGDSDPSPEEAA